MFDNESFSHVGGSSPASNGIFTISTGDEFTVMMKGDGTTSLVVDIYSMNLTFVEM